MMKKRLVLVWLAATLAALVALAPVSLLVNAPGVSGLLSAQAASGTVWSGRLRRAAVAGAPIGDLALGVSPSGLLTGRVALRVRRLDAPGAATLLLSGVDRGVRGLSLRTPADLDRAGMAMPGVIILESVDAVFKEGRCARAGGRIIFQSAPGEGPSLGALSGSPKCQGESWVVTLDGAGTEPGTSLTARIDARSIQLTLDVRTTDPVLLEALQAQGLKRSATGARQATSIRLPPSV